MDDLLLALSRRIQARRNDVLVRRKRLSRHYACRCGNCIYFADTRCGDCGATLGYLPEEGRLAALDEGPRSGTWRADEHPGLLEYCTNHDSPAACNWMVDADSPEQLCASCRLTRAVPDLSDPDNADYWRRIEAAKRRLVSHLLALGPPLRSKLHDDPQSGVMFDFLRSPPEGPRVMTGHADGLITLNVEEADDAKREEIRNDLHEPYRTLLGHFRHEIGHYYWDRLIWDSRWLEPFRALFGDERASYAEALKRNYEEGPPANWADTHVSAYATMHPWEDWAETWAHYMHMTDSLTTAMGFGLDADDIEGDVELYGSDILYDPNDRQADHFLALLNGWREIALVLNEMARSMGQPDVYPFVLSPPAVAKLQFVQMVVSDARVRSVSSAPEGRRRHRQAIE